MAYLLTILLCVAADQAVKYYVVTHLALYESAPLLPGVVELYYIQNTGGGFSILSSHTWLLTALTAVLMAGIAAMLVKKVFPHPPAGVCGGYVQPPVYELSRFQCGGYPGGLRDHRLCRLLSAAP